MPKPLLPPLEPAGEHATIERVRLAHERCAIEQQPTGRHGLPRWKPAPDGNHQTLVPSVGNRTWASASVHGEAGPATRPRLAPVRKLKRIEFDVAHDEAESNILLLKGS